MLLQRGAEYAIWHASEYIDCRVMFSALHSHTKPVALSLAQNDGVK